MNQLHRQLVTRNLAGANPRGNYAMPIPGGSGEMMLGTSRTAMIDGSINEIEMSAKFRLVDGSMDDEGDIIDPAGCLNHMARFKANPCVLWHHCKDEPPIGMCEDRNKNLHWQVTPREIVATFFFHCLPFRGENLSQEIFDLVVRGALRGASIGMIPIRAKRLTYDEDGPKHYLEWMPTEGSVTPIPAHADTLRQCLDKPGIVKNLGLRSRLSAFIIPPNPSVSVPDLGAIDMSKPRKLEIKNIECSRKVFKSLNDAAQVLKVRGKDVSDSAELATSYVFVQKPGPAGAGRKSLGDGITANLGYVTKAYGDDEDEDKKKAETLEDETVEKEIDETEEEAEIEEPEVVEDAEATEEATEEVAEDVAEDSEALKAEAADLAKRIVHFQTYIDHATATPHNGPAKDKLAKLDADMAKVVADLTKIFGANYSQYGIDALAGPTADAAPVVEEAVEKSDDDVYDDDVLKFLKRAEHDITSARKRTQQVTKTLDFPGRLTSGRFGGVA